MVNQNNVKQNTEVILTKGFGIESELSNRTNHNTMTVGEVRNVLNDSLKGKELFEYIRQERSER